MLMYATRNFVVTLSRRKSCAGESNKAKLDSGAEKQERMRVDTSLGNFSVDHAEEERKGATLSDETFNE